MSRPRIHVFPAFSPAGECVDEYGKPLTHILAREFGYGFIFSYVFSYMLVVGRLVSIL